MPNMTSTYIVSPPTSFRDDRLAEARNVSQPDHSQAQHHRASSPIPSSHLSPYSSQRLHSNSASPTFINNDTNTPAESISTLSHYQSSDFSDIDDNADPFFGVDFSNTEGGTPSFLEDQILPVSRSSSFGQAITHSYAGPTARNAFENNTSSTYPLSPEQTASLHTASPPSERKGFTNVIAGQLPNSISPQELQKPFKPGPISTYSVPTALQLTPDQSGSGRSSEDSLAPAAALMASQSPRVTVSLWGKDATSQPIQSFERTFAPDDESPAAARPGASSAGDLISSSSEYVPRRVSLPKEDMGSWQRSPVPVRRGLDPEERPSTEVESVNEMVKGREIQEKNQEVDKWLTQNMGQVPPEEVSQSSLKALETPLGPDSLVADDKIPLGDKTENNFIPGQTYYRLEGGAMTKEDLEIMNSNRNWADAPIIHPISTQGAARYQPESSNAAIQRFERMCMDNESIVSKAATWGTRRRSLPSIIDLDIEGITSGNFLKKLSISRGDKRRPSLLKDLRGLVRRPSASQLLKRTRSNHDEEGFNAEGSTSQEKRDSIPHLAPPSRTSSWGTKKTPMPSINTALIAMGGSVASIGATHARNGSISATPVTSPKSPFGSLQVKNTLRRPRSKSDLPKGSSSDAQSGLVGMWRKSGGPPVASLAKTTAAAEVDDDEDEDDDLYEDGDMKVESSKLIEDITPTFAGFKEHILRLNASLATSNTYLVDRIAHQQIVRYKSLLNAKVKHLQLGASCPCGSLCIDQGGSANVLDQHGDPRSLDPLASKFDTSDGDTTPVEGQVTPESFPQDIPMPPTHKLPAEFECQLCYQTKKFQKPSDWTKHVHEDVQPFTCTWDRCRDPKIFKRKADWVRHENEGHRHLEWWTCDVEECRHTCYRRDNFLQHLVREHKFPEPKVKTKAALKRAGGIDGTWQKVEKCHQETPTRPQDEPCRFCGKTFPSWKKLTVHLAKHMEHISLPVLRLVAAKELEPDSIISPVQDPPPRASFNQPIPNAPPMFIGYGHGGAMRAERNGGPPSIQQQAAPMQQMLAHHGGVQAPPLQLMHDPSSYAGSNSTTFGFAGVPIPQFQEHMFNSHYDPMGQALQQPAALDARSVNMGNSTFGQQQFQNVPATSVAYMETQQSYMTAAQALEPFPMLNQNSLGLQHSSNGQMGGQMGYDGIADQSSTTDPYTSQGSVSPYSHSPHQGQTGFYNH